MEESEKLSLVNLKGGACVEMFDRALDKVIENINDINTTLKNREINMKVKFTPSEDRSFIAYTIQVDPKLQGQEPEKAMAVVKIDQRGRAYAVVHKRQQQEIPFNITQLRRDTTHD